MARLSLHSFVLLEDSSIPEYKDRVLILYQSACDLIEMGLEHHQGDNNTNNNNNSSHNLEYHPFFSVQMFISAAFAILRVSTNGFFRLLIDAPTAGKLVESAIAALRKASVVNNDLPARLGDVIGFFCTLSDAESIGGSTVEDLQLREVRNRLSVSVVYDSLWTWRRHFLPEQVQQGQQVQQQQQQQYQQQYQQQQVQQPEPMQPTNYMDDQQGMFGWLSNEEFAMPSGVGGWMDLDMFV